MILFLERKRAHVSFKLLTVFIILSFLLSSAVYLNRPASKTYASYLPEPGKMLSLTPASSPTVLRGVTIYPQEPFRFDFIVEDGDEKLEAEKFKQESQQLIKYFLAALTIPEDDIWVNLSPYEQDRITPYNLGVTELGKGLLAQDYVLKQLLASLMHPETPTGERFWKKVYKKAYELYKTTNIPINTFNKVWIMPAKAVVETKDNTAYVAQSKLKVLLEEDYLALRENKAQRNKGLEKISDDEAKALNRLSSSIVKEIVLPELEKEINQGKNFALLRQVYNSLILAVWFKAKLKEHIVNQIYADKDKVKGVDLEDKETREKIYQQYLEAYKKGVYDYIKTDYDLSQQKEISRRYYGGGFDLPQEEWMETKQVRRFSSSPSKRSRSKVEVVLDSAIRKQPTSEPTNKDKGRPDSSSSSPARASLDYRQTVKQDTARVNDTARDIVERFRREGLNSLRNNYQVFGGQLALTNHRLSLGRDQIDIKVDSSMVGYISLSDRGDQLAINLSRLQQRVDQEGLKDSEATAVVEAVVIHGVAEAQARSFGADNQEAFAVGLAASNFLLNDFVRTERISKLSGVSEIILPIRAERETRLHLHGYSLQLDSIAADNIKARLAAESDPRIQASLLKGLEVRINALSDARAVSVLRSSIGNLANIELSQQALRILAQAAASNNIDAAKALRMIFKANIDSVESHLVLEALLEHALSGQVSKAVAEIMPRLYANSVSSLRGANSFQSRESQAAVNLVEHVLDNQGQYDFLNPEHIESGRLTLERASGNQKEGSSSSASSPSRQPGDAKDTYSQLIPNIEERIQLYLQEKEENLRLRKDRLRRNLEANAPEPLVEDVKKFVAESEVELDTARKNIARLRELMAESRASTEVEKFRDALKKVEAGAKSYDAERKSAQLSELQRDALEIVEEEFAENREVYFNKSNVLFISADSWLRDFLNFNYERFAGKHWRVNDGVNSLSIILVRDDKADILRVIGTLIHEAIHIMFSEGGAAIRANNPQEKDIYTILGEGVVESIAIEALKSIAIKSDRVRSAFDELEAEIRSQQGQLAQALGIEIDIDQLIDLKYGAYRAYRHIVAQMQRLLGEKADDILVQRFLRKGEPKPLREALGRHWENIKTISREIVASDRTGSKAKFGASTYMLREALQQDNLEQALEMVLYLLELADNFEITVQMRKHDQAPAIPYRAVMDLFEDLVDEGSLSVGDNQGAVVSKFRQEAQERFSELESPRKGRSSGSSSSPDSSSSPAQASNKRLRDILNFLRQHEAVRKNIPEVSEDTSDQELIELAIEYLEAIDARDPKKRPIVTTELDRDGNRIVMLDDVAVGSYYEEIGRLVDAVLRSVVEHDNGIKAISFLSEDGTWTIVGFKQELQNKDILRHAQQEVLIKKLQAKQKEAASPVKLSSEQRGQKPRDLSLSSLQPTRKAAEVKSVGPQKGNQNLGGIDLTPENLDLEVRGQSIEFLQPQIPFDLKTFEGFTFRILRIEPIKEPQLNLSRSKGQDKLIPAELW